jgi:hypothetical protein
MLYDTVAGLWAYLAASSLAWLFATVAAYLLGRCFHERLRGHQAANPIVIAIIVLGGVLWRGIPERQNRRFPARAPAGAYARASILASCAFPAASSRACTAIALSVATDRASARSRATVGAWWRLRGVFTVT